VWDPSATAELVQQVVLLNGQALIEAAHDPTVSPEHMLALTSVF